MKRRSSFTLVGISLIAANQAHAYIGPGAGLSAIGSILALVGATVLLILGFIWYPFKRLLQRRKDKSMTEETATDPEDTAHESEQLGSEEQVDES